MPAELHELRPLEYRCVFRDLFYLAALGQHVSDPDRLCQLVLDAGDDDVLYLRVLTDGLDLMVELVESDDHDRARHVQIVLDLFLG